MNKRFYIVRHAQSEANSGGISRPDREITLSAIGRQQAETVARILPEPSAVFVSEMRRTQETAAPYCRLHQTQTQILPLLNEFSYLPFEQVCHLDADGRRPLSHAYWQRANPLEQTSAECDSFSGFSRRVQDFIRLIPELPDGAVCFGHGIWLAMLIWQNLGMPSESSEDMRAFRAWQPHLPMPNTAAWQIDACGHHLHIQQYK